MRDLLLLSLSVLLGSTTGQIRFESNGYSNVIVTISPDVGPENAEGILQGIEVEKHAPEKPSHLHFSGLVHRWKRGPLQGHGEVGLHRRSAHFAAIKLD